MKRSEKPFFVSNLAEELKASSSVVLVDHTGLTVKMQQDLKKKLKVVGAKMTIVKNTLFKLAAQKAKSPKEVVSDTALSGPTAMVITEDDPIAPLQALHKFAKEFEIPQLKVGIIEGSFQDLDKLTALAILPNKEILVGQTIGAIGAPLYGFIGVLNAKMQELIYILNEYQGKKVKE